MKFIPNHCYHVYNRGNNKKKLFDDYQDYSKFLYLMRGHLIPFSDLLCYCLMPNHFHFMIHAKEESSVERKFGLQSYQELSYRLGILQSSYTRYYNNKYGLTGSLFSKKVKQKDLFINEFGMPLKKYLTTCMHYIHQNPLRAGLVHAMEKWQFSSFADIAGLRKGTICSYELLQQLTGYDEEFYKESYGVIEDRVRLSFKE